MKPVAAKASALGARTSSPAVFGVSPNTSSIKDRSPHFLNCSSLVSRHRQSPVSQPGGDHRAGHFVAHAGAGFSPASTSTYKLVQVRTSKTTPQIFNFHDSPAPNCTVSQDPQSVFSLQKTVGQVANAGLDAGRNPVLANRATTQGGATGGAGFQTCRAADFQIGVEQAGLETRGTADLEVCATKNEMHPLSQIRQFSPLIAPALVALWGPFAHE